MHEAVHSAIGYLMETNGGSYPPDIGMLSLSTMYEEVVADRLIGESGKVLDTQGLRAQHLQQTVNRCESTYRMGEDCRNGNLNYFLQALSEIYGLNIDTLTVDAINGIVFPSK